MHCIDGYKMALFPATNSVALTFEISRSVRYVVDLLRQDDRGYYHVADGQVAEEYVRHCAHRLYLHYCNDDAHIAEEADEEKHRDEGNEQ